MKKSLPAGGEKDPPLLLLPSYLTPGQSSGVLRQLYSWLSFFLFPLAPSSLLICTDLLYLRDEGGRVRGRERGREKRRGKRRGRGGEREKERKYACFSLVVFNSPTEGSSFTPNTLPFSSKKAVASVSLSGMPLMSTLTFTKSSFSVILVDVVTVDHPLTETHAPLGFGALTLFACFCSWPLFSCVRHWHFFSWPIEGAILWCLSSVLCHLQRISSLV